MWYSAVGSIVTLLLSLLAIPLAAAAPPPGQVYRMREVSGERMPTRPPAAALRRVA